MDKDYEFFWDHSPGPQGEITNYSLKQISDKVGLSRMKVNLDTIKEIPKMSSGTFILSVNSAIIYSYNLSSTWYIFSTLCKKWFSSCTFPWKELGSESNIKISRESQEWSYNRLFSRENFTPTLLFSHFAISYQF